MDSGYSWSSLVLVSTEWTERLRFLIKSFGIV